jgi:Ca-activated chloride channel homolog
MNKYFGVGLLIIGFVTPCAASPARQIRQGNKYYAKGDFPSALKSYERALEKAPESDAVNFDMGTALYKKEEYEQAIAHFQKALLGDNKELQNKAHYNLGGSFYRLGIKEEGVDNIEGAIKLVEESLKEYEKVLSKDKEDKDAKHNFDFVTSELKRLQEKLKQEKNKQCPNPKDKDSKDSQSKQEQKKESQDQEKQNQQNQQQAQQDQQKQQQASQQQSQQEKQNQEKEGKGQNSQQEQSQQAQNQESQKEKESGKESSQPKDKSSEQKKDSSSGEKSSGQPTEEKKASSSGNGVDQKEMSPKEAEMLLERYEQNGKPKGLLNLIPKEYHTPSVEKDW